MSDQENKIKCPVCGAECPSEAKFCRKCGVSLNTAETAREPSGIKEGAENNDSPSGQKSGSAPGVTIPLPAVIAGGALIIVLAALILRFTVFQKAGDGENRQDDSVSETAAREGETSFEEVDIDAVHNSVNEISGKITNEGPVLVIDLPEPESVYIYDPGEMREALIRDVSRIYIDEGTSIDLDTYFGAEVTVAGTLAMAGQDISISVTEITASNIETDFNEAFGISETTVEDYGVNLDPGQYGHYDSGISEFNFSYPTALYNAVTVDETAWQSEMGENVQTISFSGSEGSELIFSLSRRTDGLSVKGMTERTASGARRSVTEFEEILNMTKDGYGKLVFTGWTDGSYEKTVYCLVKVEDSYIMSMTVVTPNYKGNQDELHKGYVTECLYRMCGFSDATAPWRSFNEYVEG